MPQLRGRIDYWEISTPLSMQRFCGYGRGELYGLDHDPERFARAGSGHARASRASGSPGRT